MFNKILPNDHIHHHHYRCHHHYSCLLLHRKNQSSFLQCFTLKHLSSFDCSLQNYSTRFHLLSLNLLNHIHRCHQNLHPNLYLTLFAFGLFSLLSLIPFFFTFSSIPRISWMNLEHVATSLKFSGASLTVRICVIPTIKIFYS